MAETPELHPRTVVEDEAFRYLSAPGPSLTRSLGRVAAVGLALTVDILATTNGWISLPWGTFLGAVTVLGWAVTVLGAELERLIAIAVVPVVLTVALLSGLWIWKVQPAIDQAGQQIYQLTHPSITGTAGDAATRAADAAKAAARSIASHLGGKP